MGSLYSILGDMAVPRYLLAAFPESFNNLLSLALNRKGQLFRIHPGLSVVKGIRATLESLGPGGKGWLWRRPPLSHIGRS